MKKFNNPVTGPNANRGPPEYVLHVYICVPLGNWI